MDRLSFRQDWRIRTLHAPADGRGGNARYHRRRSLPLRPGLVAGQQETPLLGQTAPALVRQRRRQETSSGGQVRLWRYFRWKLVAGQPVAQLFQAPSPRLQRRLYIFAERQESQPSFRWLLQRQQSHFQWRRQV